MTVMTALSGQRVVIVGGTSGMGLGAARAAADAGAEVVVARRRPVAERGHLDASTAGSFTHAVVDVRDQASIRALFETVGRLDHLLVTATPPLAERTGFLDQDIDIARDFMNGKFFGSLACAQYAAPRMPAGGSITFLTGAAVLRAPPGLSSVAATFAAVEALSRALAVELGPLRVNTIRPGVIDSDMWSFLDPAAREELRHKVRQVFPVRRVGTIEDIGHAALFLMTNPYVTGTVLEVTGGEQLVDAF
jgi:NAD(P)-dependent dehydrogenase (short-subunit alcohol dehydrogenase family)